MEMARLIGDACIFSMELVGGLPCFDFTNTLDGHGIFGATAIEYLRDYRDLVACGQPTSALTADEATQFSAKVACQPDVAAQVVHPCTHDAHQCSIYAQVGIMRRV